MTLFSEIDNQFSEKDGRSPFFYRRAFRGLVTAYANNPRKFITDEKKDREGVDENLLRRVPKMGHLMIGQYNFWINMEKNKMTTINVRCIDCHIVNIQNQT